MPVSIGVLTGVPVQLAAEAADDGSAWRTVGSAAAIGLIVLGLVLRARLHRSATSLTTPPGEGEADDSG